MPVTKDNPAPYAPPRVILEIIERHRSRGLPSPVDAEVLGRAGISDSLISRTLQALQTLDLIGEDGSHTEILEGLRLAPDPEYKERLAEWLNAAYADVLNFANPATDGDTQIRDAFRPYKPTGQQPRMVTLFNGLFEAAGVMAEKPVTKPKRTRSGTRGGMRGKPADKPTRDKFKPASGLPAPLAGLLSSLPTEGGGWTQEQRDKFVETFGAVVDFCFPIVKPQAPEQEQTSEEEAET